jgi:hypothetical protein
MRQKGGKRAMTPQQTLCSWLIGLGGVSLILGSLVTWAIWKGLHSFYEDTVRRRKWDVDLSKIEKIPLYPFWTGVLERVMFTLLIAFEVSGVSGGIFAWVGIKMATGWGRISGGETPYRMLAFTGLLSSLTSMLFAVVGGLICNGQIPIYRLFQ